MEQPNAQVKEKKTSEKKQVPAKSLNFWSLVSLGLGGTIGGPIFVIIGTVISTAGAGSLVSLAINGVLMLTFVMNFSELALSLPMQGGGYSFSKEAIGGLRGFLIGWSIWVGNLLFAALSGLGFSYSIAIFLPDRQLPQFVINIIGIAVIALFYVLNLRFPKLVKKIMVVLTFILVGGFLIYIILGFLVGTRLNPEYSTQILKGDYNFGSILNMTAFTFVIYCVYEWNSTFESLTTEIDRIKQPRKNIPRAFIGSLVIGIIIYWLTTLVTLLNLGQSGSDAWQVVTNSEAPLADAFFFVFNRQSFGIYFMALIGMVATITSINAGLQMSTHLLHSMARDKYLPGIFQKERKNVQWVALTGSSIVVFAITSFAADANAITYITEISNFIFLVSMFVISLSVILLRKTRPKLIRPWKVPLYPFTPILSMVTSLILIVTMIFSVTGRFGVVFGVIIVLTGLLFYFFKIVRRDRLLLMLAGIKIGICILLISLLSGLQLNFERLGISYPFFKTILIIFSIIGIITLLFDVIPIRKMISLVARKSQEVVVVSGIFQLSSKQSSLAKILNRILGAILFGIGLYCLILTPFIVSDFFTISSGFLEFQLDPDQYLDQLVFIVVLLVGIIFILQSVLKFLQEYEIIKVQESKPSQ